MKEMWMMGWEYRTILVVVLAGTIPANVYPFILARLRWNVSNIGRSMFFKGLALMLVFDSAIAGLWFADEEWFILLTMFIDIWLTFSVTYQVIVVRDVIRKGEAERRLGKTHPEGVA